MNTLTHYSPPGSGGASVAPPKIVPSPEQQAIFDAFLQGHDNIAIAAGAGTGKTFTLVELAKRLPRGGYKLFSAFNRDIVKELKVRLDGTGMWAKTFHGIGYGALIKKLKVKTLEPDNDKYPRLIAEWMNSKQPLATELRTAINDSLDTEGFFSEEIVYLRGELTTEVGRMLNDLIRFMRLKLVEWQDEKRLEFLVDYYNLIESDAPMAVKAAIKGVPYIMQKAEAMLSESASLDFTDMLYWPVRWDLWLFQQDYVFVDEAQDLSPVQRKLVAKCLKRTGRIVAVGDKSQAIYGFAGADSNSFDLTVKWFDCKVLPLSVSRRCSQVVAYHASQLVPGFKPLPDAPRGKIVWIDEALMTSEVRPGDMVLCRIKAPLVIGCINCITANKPATILGTDIGKQLIDDLEKITTRKDFKWDDLQQHIIAHRDEQVARWERKGDEQMMEVVQDTMTAIEAIVERAQAPNFEALKAYILSLFSDESTEAMVTFATVHKSKGLEAERVFLLRPDKMPLRYPGMRAESYKQEKNLEYVAITRAKHTLVYLTNDDFLDRNDMPDYVQEDFDDHQWFGEQFEFVDVPPEALQPDDVDEDDFYGDVIDVEVIVDEDDFAPPVEDMVTSPGSSHPALPEPSQPALFGGTEPSPTTTSSVHFGRPSPSAKRKPQLIEMVQSLDDKEIDAMIALLQVVKAERAEAAK